MINQAITLNIGNFLLEPLILASTNPQYDKRIVHTTCSEHVIFSHWTGNSMNNFLSYCGLVDAKISTSEKDLPVSV